MPSAAAAAGVELFRAAAAGVELFRAAVAGVELSRAAVAPPARGWGELPARGNLLSRSRTQGRRMQAGVPHPGSQRAEQGCTQNFALCKAAPRTDEEKEVDRAGLTLHPEQQR